MLLSAIRWSYRYKAAILCGILASSGMYIISASEGRAMLAGQVLVVLLTIIPHHPASSHIIPRARRARQTLRPPSTLRSTPFDPSHLERGPHDGAVARLVIVVQPRVERHYPAHAVVAPPRRAGQRTVAHHRLVPRPPGFASRGDDGGVVIDSFYAAWIMSRGEMTGRRVCRVHIRSWVA